MELLSITFHRGLDGFRRELVSNVFREYLSLQGDGAVHLERQLTNLGRLLPGESLSQVDVICDGPTLLVRTRDHDGTRRDWVAEKSGCDSFRYP